MIALASSSLRQLDNNVGMHVPFAAELHKVGFPHSSRINWGKG
jgi:hypothetical protein